MKKIILIFLIIQNTMYSQNTCEEKDTTIMRVPIVFHIIHKYKTQKDIPIGVFFNLVNNLNKNFNNVDELSINPLFRKDIAKCNIEFYIPNPDKSCINNVISWHKTTKKEYSFSSNDPFTDVGNEYKDSNKFLNVYIVNIEDGAFGYVSNKFINYGNKRYDGVVIDIQTLYQDLDNNPFTITQKIAKNNIASFTLTHEIGHLFGLVHPFGGHWLEPFAVFDGLNGCLIGDGIEDTAKQKTENNASINYNVNTKRWKKIIKTCYDNTKITNYHNFMDYGFGLPSGQGMFTKCQRKKMRDNLINKRFELIKYKKCDTNTGSFVDIRDNKKYLWVQVGTQKWMSENLNYYSSASKCHSDKEENCNRYGRLYTWKDAQNVCPKGWHLPSSKEWEVLRKYLGGVQSKIRSTSGWDRYRNGTNSSGLNFLPSGIGHEYFSRYKYKGIGNRTQIWLSDDGVWGGSRMIGDYGFKTIPWSGGTEKKSLLSCRCISD